MNKVTLKTATPFVLLVLISLLALFVPSLTNFDDGKYNGADIAWIIVATALVFLMTPGLAFFYGGMVNRKNVISTMIKSLIAAGIVSVLWIVVGYSLCFGPDVKGLGLIGDPMTHFMFKGVNSGKPWVFMPTVPLTLFALFQLMYAILRSICDFIQSARIRSSGSLELASGRYSCQMGRPGFCRRNRSSYISGLRGAGGSHCFKTTQKSY